MVRLRSRMIVEVKVGEGKNIRGVLYVSKSSFVLAAVYTFW